MSFTATTTNPVSYTRLLGRWNEFDPGSLTDADQRAFYRAGRIVGDIVRSGDVAAVGTDLKAVVVSSSGSLAVTVSTS